MKKTIILLAMVLVSSFVYSQGIEFESSDLSKALKKAKKENKLVFIDVYTTWCGPCKIMSKKVFTDKKVGDVYNKYFVNLKVDAESKSGAKLCEVYDVKGYPTLLYLSANGEVISKEIGSKSIYDFIGLAMKSMGLDVQSNDTIKEEMMAAYKSGNYLEIVKLAKPYFERLKGDDQIIMKKGKMISNSFLKGDTDQIYNKGLEFCNIYASYFEDCPAPIYVTRGKLYLKLNDKKQASAMFKEAIDKIEKITKESGKDLNDPRAQRAIVPIKKLMQSNGL